MDGRWLMDNQRVDGGWTEDEQRKDRWRISAQQTLQCVRLENNKLCSHC